VFRRCRSTPGPNTRNPAVAVSASILRANDHTLCGRIVTLAAEAALNRSHGWRPRDHVIE
jgi:hypothetical protein